MFTENKSICRVCLNCDRSICTGIFEKINEIFVYEKLNTIANININPKDGLPDKICSDCLSELENAIIFRQKCETSNNILVSAIPMNIEIAKQQYDFSKKQVKEEEQLDECTDHEYLEEEPSIPPELPLKHELYEEKHSLEIHLEPPLKPSKAINLQPECHDCGSIFKSKCKLKVHWFKTHLKAQLTCNICENTFGSFATLKNHKLNRTKRCATLIQVRIEGVGNSRMYHCKECVYSSKYIDTMTKHLESHSGECNYTCNLCPAKYIYLNSLDAHMESKHGIYRKSVVCTICGEMMGKRQYYKHLRKHKTSETSDSLKCNVCNKVSKNKQCLKVHMERHAGVKKYACNKCGKSYTTYNCLYSHNKQVHGPKDVIYKCNECEFTNANRNMMRKHKLNHSKYHYVCTKCGKFFENDKQLSCHEERHISNYKCQQCEKTFYSRKAMMRHMNKCHDIYFVRNLKSYKKNDKNS